MKLYYDDPIMALYMHREFDVQFVSYMDNSISDLDLIKEIIEPKGLTTLAPYIVAKSSENIFDIRFWDVAIIQRSYRKDAKKYYGIINNITGMSIMIGKAVIPLDGEIRKEILKREDKLFFMPKRS